MRFVLAHGQPTPNQLYGAVAMNKRPMLIGAWLVVASILMYFAILDILRWRADPDFIRMGLNWTDSSLPNAFVAAVVGCACLSTNRIALWIAVLGASLFGLYYAAYLIFGGEGAFLLRVVVPATLLWLTGMTIQYGVRNLKARS